MSNGEKVLVARHSAFQAIRLTEDAAGLRTLCFGPDAASQSVVKASDPGHLELPYARLLPACLVFSEKPVRVLIVGLGGATLPRFLHRHFPEMMIDVVELDPDVVALAKEFCGLCEDARLRVFVGDGRDFIEASSGGYDVIILDGFDIDSIPAHLSTLEFLQAVRKALASGGVAIANIWGRGINPLYGSMLRTYEAAFDEVYIFDVPGPGTKIFVALPHSREMTRADVIQKAHAMSERHAFSYDLPGAIAGFRKSTLESIRAGTVMHDADL